MVSYKTEREGAWLCFSQVGFTRGESGDRFHFTRSLVLPPCRRPSLQPKNLRAALNPSRCSSTSQHARVLVFTPPPLVSNPKGVFVLRLVDEVQSVFWAKHAHPLTQRRTLTSTGLQTKITLPCLLRFLLNPLQHMTCVTATDLHWTIRAVQGQGKSPKQRKERGWGLGGDLIEPTPFFFIPSDELFKKFISPKCLAYFMVL